MTSDAYVLRPLKVVRDNVSTQKNKSGTKRLALVVILRSFFSVCLLQANLDVLLGFFDVELVLAEEPTKAKIEFLFALHFSDFLEFFACEATIFVQCLPNLTGKYTGFFVEHV